MPAFEDVDARRRAGTGTCPPTHRAFALQAGFTLLELLVATTITAVIAGFIVILVSNVAGVWTRTSNRLTADAQARYILDQLALDLSSAQFRDDGNVWLAANVLDGTGNNVTTFGTNNSGLWQTAAANPKPRSSNGVGFLDMNATRQELQPAERGVFANSRFGEAGIWLRFFTTKRGSNTISSTNVTDPSSVSAPVAVGYQIVRRVAISTGTDLTKAAYLLHRAEVRPGAATRPGVLETGYNITAAAYQSPGALANNTGATTGDPRGIKVPGSATVPRNLDSVIGTNVIDFGVRFYALVPDANTGSPILTQTFPATATTPLSYVASLPPAVKNSSGNYTNDFPQVVDVMVRILTDEGARLIALYEQANTPLTLPTGRNAQQYWWDLAMSHSQVFTRRIVINAHSL